MTGFGKAECVLPHKKLVIEIRSLNSKQMDANIRVPGLYREKELEIRQLIAAELERGKVECTMMMELNGEEGSVVINESLVKEYYEHLYRISGELGLKPSLELLNMVMRMPDTVKTARAELEEEEWKVVRKALREALIQVNRFRASEGRALENDMKARVDAISSRLTRVDPYENERIKLVRERIGNNLTTFSSKEEPDQNRFEQELIYYLEKLDISEEKVRLAKHCSYFLETMEEDRAVGKKLGFISQEMGREINTLGSKANHAEIQKLVVEMKDELERIKEQVLNVL